MSTVAVQTEPLEHVLNSLKFVTACNVVPPDPSHSDAEFVRYPQVKRLQSFSLVVSGENWRVTFSVNFQPPSAPNFGPVTVSLTMGNNKSDVYSSNPKLVSGILEALQRSSSPVPATKLELHKIQAICIAGDAVLQKTDGAEAAFSKALGEFSLPGSTRLVDRQLKTDRYDSTGGYGEGIVNVEIPVAFAFYNAIKVCSFVASRMQQGGGAAAFFNSLLGAIRAFIPSGCYTDARAPRTGCGFDDQHVA
jgi:hypothetical protein